MSRADLHPVPALLALYNMGERLQATSIGASNRFQQKITLHLQQPSYGDDTDAGAGAHRAGDEESGEEEPEGVEGGGDDRGQLHMRRDSHRHHAVEGEVEQREVGEQQVPEELGCTTHAPPSQSQNGCTWF